MEVAAQRWSACYAPHAAMYFDQFGKVRACCQNTGVYLGDVTTQSLREIWESADADSIRAAVERHDYSRGCEFCEWQVREGNDAIVFARTYDRFEPSERRPSWPQHLQFALTNTCNLQCVMCNGDWSSTIRAKREGRRPIPPAYDDTFFDQLAPFLERCSAVVFAGGEPFLGKEPLRVMEMLSSLADPPHVTIITNGTVWTARVARIIEALRPHLTVSIDGASAETYDRIRLGAHYPEVVANLDRFAAAVGAENMSVTACLMRDNWHEFAAILTLAERRGLNTLVNVVRFPEAHSLYQLPADELANVVETLQATEVDLTGPRHDCWTGHVSALAHRLDVLRDPGRDLGPGHGLPGIDSVPAEPLDEDAVVAMIAQLAVDCGDEPAHLEVVDDRVQVRRAGSSWFAAIGGDSFGGSTLPGLLSVMEHHTDGPVLVEPMPDLAPGVSRWAHVLHGRPGRPVVVAHRFRAPNGTVGVVLAPDRTAGGGDPGSAPPAPTSR